MLKLKNVSKSKKQQYAKGANARLVCGFTLIETMVAVVILVVGVSPSYLAAVRAMTIAGMIRNNLVAANLAQEGIEVVRAMRDTSWFNGVGFNTFATNIVLDCPVPTGCRIQHNSVAPITALPVDQPLLAHPIGVDDYVYDYDSGTPTGYTRTIIVTPVGASGLFVQSAVTWIDRGNAESVKIGAYLFDWK